MNKLIVSIVFIVIALYGINAYTADKGMCPKFLGDVKCATGTLQATARVILKADFENVKNQILAKQPITANAMFHISGCADSNINSTEMYLEFFDVCSPADYHITYKFIADEMNYFNLNNNTAEANISE